MLGTCTSSLIKLEFDWLVAIVDDIQLKIEIKRNQPFWIDQSKKDGARQVSSQITLDYKIHLLTLVLFAEILKGSKT